MSLSSTRSLSIYFLSLFLVFSFLSLSSFWVLHSCLCCILSTGRRSLVHIFFIVIFCVLYFSLHTLLYLSRESVVRNDSLIQRLGRQRSGIGVKTVPGSCFPCNRLTLLEISRSWPMVSRPLGKFFLQFVGLLESSFLENFCRVRLRLSLRSFQQKLLLPKL